jgi:hypothetical protein
VTGPWRTRQRSTELRPGNGATPSRWSWNRIVNDPHPGCSLVNTSLNGRGEPIVETPEQAAHFFVTHPGVDLLLLNDYLVARGASPSASDLRLAPDTIVSLIYPQGRRRILLTRRGISHEIPEPAFAVLDDVGSDGVRRVDAPAVALVGHELEEAFHLGLLTGAVG